MILHKTILPLSLSLLLIGAAHAQRPDWFRAPLLAENNPGDFELFGDVDLDGDVDPIAFLSPYLNSIRTSFTPMLNDGFGRLTPGTSVSLPKDAGARTHFADVDGDGRGDVLVSTLSTSSMGAGILIYPGQAGGRFGAPAFVSFPGNSTFIGSGHIDGDGILDILVHHYGTTTWQAQWFRGSSSRVFSPGPGITIPPELAIGSTVVLDADGDGTADFASATDGSVHLFVTRPAGIQKGPVVATPAGYSNSLVVTDFDKDGDPDLVVAFTPGWNQHSLARIVNGGGNWSLGLTQSFSSLSTVRMYAGDWDGDGREDLVIRGMEMNYPSTILRYHVCSYLRNVASGGYQLQDSVVHVGRQTANFGAGLTRLDSDPHLDLVDSRSFYFGDGTFDRGLSGPQITNPVDWDGDGDIDQFGEPMWINDGRGQFRSVARGWPNPGSLQQFGEPVGTTDLDGDGLHEVLVPLWRNVFPRNYEFVGMHLLREKPEGGFADAGPAAAPKAAMNEGLFADVDSDGDLDFLDTQGVWINDGKNVFAQAGPSFQQYRPLAVGDIDGDGLGDVLGTFTGNGTGLAVFLRTGPGQFKAQVLYQSSRTPTPPASAVLIDLDEDGDLDVAGVDLPYTSTGGIRVFENVAGSLVGHPVLDTYGPHLSAGDVDGDGRVDLVASDDRITRVLRRSGPGFTYDAPVAFAVGGARSLLDVDQDGDLDLVGAVQVRNRRFEGPAAGSRRQYGVSAPGAGGRRPIASITGPIRVGETPRIRLRNAVGGSFCYVMVGAQESNTPSVVIPGVTLYASPYALLQILALPGASGAPGAGALDIPLQIANGLGGVRAYFQFLISDPAGQNWTTSHTGGVEVEIGR